MNRYRYQILKEIQKGKRLLYFPEIGCMKIVDISEIESGDITPYICNVGIFKTDCIDIFDDLVKSRAFSAWRGMLHRCYVKIPNTYKGVTVCKEWHNFTNFAVWHKMNSVEGWCLDKDLFSIEGIKKVYSPDNCCYIPPVINNSIRAKVDVIETKTGCYYFNDTSFGFSNRRIYGDSYQETYKLCLLYRQTHIRTLVSEYWKQMKDNVREKLIHLYDNEEGQIFKSK